MVILNHNSANEVVLNLTSNSQLWNVSGITPYFLFQFTSESSNATIYFVSSNISTATTRYDEFIITETGSTYVNLTNGDLYLRPSIYWNYTVYEQTSQFNLNPNNTVGVVNSGLVFVSGYTGYNPTYYINTGTSIFTYYQYTQNN